MRLVVFTILAVDIMVGTCVKSVLNMYEQYTLPYSLFFGIPIGIFQSLIIDGLLFLIFM